MRDTERRIRRQKRSLLNKSRWVAYAAAGAATALGASEAADAGYIQHVDPADIVVNNTTKRVDLDGDGNADAVFIHSTYIYGGIKYGWALGSGTGAGNLALIPGTYPFSISVRNVATTEKINDLPYFYQHQGNMNFGPDLGEFPAGDPPVIGFVGFSLDLNGNTEYGWLRVEMLRKPSGPLNQITITDWAYTVGGGDIYPGQVPEPGSLGLLATGALGLLLWRRARRGSKEAT